MPEPLKITELGLLLALDAMVNVPVGFVPGIAGVNVIPIVQLAAGASVEVVAQDPPLRAKFPLTVISEMENVKPPVFDTVTISAALVVLTT